jgi:hypothetical protein
MKALLIAALCLLAVPAAAQTVDRDKAVVGRDSPASTAALAKGCQTDPSRCEGFLMGASTFVGADIAPHCRPPNVTGAVLRAGFIQWLAKEPAAADLQGIAGVVRFLTATYPCGQRS